MNNRSIEPSAAMNPGESSKTDQLPLTNTVANEKESLFESKKEELTAQLREFVLRTLQSREWFGLSFNYSVNVALTMEGLSLDVTAVIPSQPDQKAFVIAGDFTFNQNNQKNFSESLINIDIALKFLKTIVMLVLANGRGKSAPSSDLAKTFPRAVGMEPKGFDQAAYQSFLTERMCILLARKLQEKWLGSNNYFEVKARMNEIGTLSIVLVWQPTQKETGFEVMVEADDLNKIALLVNPILDKLTDPVLTDEASGSIIDRSTYMGELKKLPSVEEAINIIVAQLIFITINARELKQKFSAHQEEVAVRSDGDEDKSLADT